MADPVRWGPGREDQFRLWFQAELQAALDARAPLENQWLRWLDMYNAPYKGVRSFPYEGAMNETIPAIAIDVDQLYAKFMQTIHAAPNLWTIGALNERWVRVAKPLQDFLEVLDSQVLRMYNVNKRALLEMVKLGTAIYKTGWTYEKRRVRVYNLDGKPEPALKIRSTPFVDHVRLADFIMPAASFAIDPDAQGGAPWVAERIRVSPDRLRMLADTSDPNLPNIKKEDLEAIIRYEESVSRWDSAIDDRDKNRRFANEKPIEQPQPHEVLASASTASRLRQIELWEVHVRYPSQSGDVYDDLVILWHQPSSRVIRSTLNPYAHGSRPYEVVRYFPGEGFYGIGVCQQKEMFQRMLSDLYNYAGDNALLSNAVMMGAKAGANIMPGEPIYPGKVWITDGNPNDELFPIRMASPNASLQHLITLTQTYGERRTGISDLQLGGMQGIPGRTPATTIVSMLQEGNRRPDLTIKDMRHEGLSRVGLRVVQLLQQYLTQAIDTDQGKMLQVMETMLGEPEGKLLTQQLLMPLDPVELGIGVSITASSGTANKEVDKQNTLALLQLAGQVAPQILQFTQLAVQGAGTPVGQVAQAAANGITELFRRALEQHDVRDAEAIVPSITPPGPVAGALPGPVGNGAGNVQPPGMEALLGALGGTAGAAGQPAPVGAA